MDDRAIITDGFRLISVPIYEASASRAWPNWLHTDIQVVIDGQTPQTRPDRFATWIKDNAIGSLRALSIAIVLIVGWMVFGQLSGLDKHTATTSWPLLLLAINLLEVPIMMVLQKSANLVQTSQNVQTVLLLRSVHDLLHAIENGDDGPRPSAGETT